MGDDAEPRRLRRRQLLLGAAGLALARPAAAAVQDGQWRDAARTRDLPWRLRLPARPGPWPLLLYSHGLGGRREGAEVWSAAWADAGFAVLHLQHPGSDIDTLRAGPAALRAAASAAQLVVRAGDVVFALDELMRRFGAGEAPWRDLRPDALGLAGHSFGARTVQAVAGERFARGLTLADARPRAFLALSPSAPADGISSPQQALGGITRPFMAATGSLDGDPFGRFDSGASRAAVFDGLPQGQRALLWLDGADHMSFAGERPGRLPDTGLLRRVRPAPQREAAHHAVLARMSSDWWRWRLLGDAQAEDALRAPEGLAAADQWRLD